MLGRPLGAQADCDRIFFITVNLRRLTAPRTDGESARLVHALATARRKLHFCLYGYGVMPDHWQAPIWTAHPLTISRAVQDIKGISAGPFKRARGPRGTVWQHQFGDRFVRHAKEFNPRLAYLHLNPVRKGLIDYTHLPATYRG